MASKPRAIISPGALRIVAGEFRWWSPPATETGHRQRRGTPSLRKISFTDSWHISLSSGKLSFYLATGFVGDALAERHPADRLVLHRVAHAPVDISCSRYCARSLSGASRADPARRSLCAPGAANREVQLVEQLILGGEIAKQRPLGHPSAAGDGRRRGGDAGLGESRGGSFQ